jgi:CRP-like cAMP-binding protein
VRFLLQGDLFSAVSLFAERLHFSVQALMQVRFARFRRRDVAEKLAADAALQTAWATSCIEEDDGAGELLLALGRRSAEERIAYVFVHLTKRIAASNVIRENRYSFPLRQQHVAALTGLTAVHVSRVLTIFRDRGLCRLSGGILDVEDPVELERIGGVK